MKPSRNPSSLQSFTLVELLVVLGIISILAALSFVAASHAIRSAHFTASTGNMRALGDAIDQYANDNDTQLPTWYNYGAGQYWWQAITPYLNGNTNSVFHDPEDRAYNGSTSDTLSSSISYGYNYQVMGRSDQESDGGYPPQRMTNVKSSYLAMADGPNTNCYGYIDDYSNIPDTNRYLGVTPALFVDGHIETLSCTNFTSEDPYFIRD